MNKDWRRQWLSVNVRVILLFGVVGLVTYPRFVSFMIAGYCIAGIAMFYLHWRNFNE